MLDPFCGKGTVLLEACLLGRRALGLDVAPDAVVVTNAKLDPPSFEHASSYLNPLRVKKQPVNRIPRQIRTFFHPGTLAQILAIRRSLLHDHRNGKKEQRRSANFLLGTMLGILHGHSKISLSIPCSHSFAMAPNYVRKYASRHGLRRPHRDVKRCLLYRSRELLSEDLPLGEGQAFLCSAEKYEFPNGKELTNSVDLIMTSPPYLDAQTYSKDSWLRFWLLGHDYKKLRSSFIETGSPGTYLEKMTPCLKEMLRVLKPLGYAVIIGGDAPFRVRGEKRFWKTAEELGALSVRLLNNGYTFKVKEMIVDEIPAQGRYYAAVHKDGGKIGGDTERKGVKVERIVVLRKVQARSG